MNKPFGSKRQRRKKRSSKHETPHVQSAPAEPRRDEFPTADAQIVKLGRFAEHESMQRLATFRRRYKKRLAKEDNEIFSLPESVIDAIKADIPEFFSPEDEQFERDLTRTTGAGLFLGSPLVHPALPARQLCAAERQYLHSSDDHPISQLIDRAQDDAWRTAGKGDSQIADYHAQIESHKNKTSERQIAYAGWLLTQREFQLDRAGFLGSWYRTIIERRQFPEVPRSYLGENPPPVPKSEREYFAAYMQFYKKWGIRSFASWELPIPLAPALDQPTLDHIPSITGAGIEVFVPWYRLRDRQIQLAEIADLSRMRASPAHLQDWLDGRPKDWGYDRYTLMLKLYVYLECCLKRRYPEKTKRKAGALDNALAVLICEHANTTLARSRKADTVRKVRLRMNRRLSTMPKIPESIQDK